MKNSTAIDRFVHDYCRALELPPSRALAIPCDVLPEEPEGFDASLAVDIVERVEVRRVHVRVVMRAR